MNASVYTEIVEVEKNSTNDSKASNLLYAQVTSFGFQLIDSEPKIVIKAYKTSSPASFIAVKGSIQGVIIANDNQWFFEYYEKNQLISEKIDVKF